MPQVQASAQVDVDVDTLWRRFGSFQRVGDWHPMLAGVEGEGEYPGAVRKARTHDGQEQVEKLQQIDPSQHFYRYTMVSGPMPVKDYVGEFRILDNHDGTGTVVWRSDFAVSPAVGPRDEANTVQSVKSFLDAGIESLKQEIRPPSGSAAS